MVTASDRSAIAFSLSGGQAHDAPQGEMLLDGIERLCEQVYMVMDRAYEGDKTRAKVIEKGFIPVVPPKKNRKHPWIYDKERYKERNEIERFFLRLKRFRKVFTRYDKLDSVFAGFIYFAMIIDALVGTDSRTCCYVVPTFLCVSRKKLQYYNVFGSKPLSFPGDAEGMRQERRIKQGKSATFCGIMEVTKPTHFPQKRSASHEQL